MAGRVSAAAGTRRRPGRPHNGFALVQHDRGKRRRIDHWSPTRSQSGLTCRYGLPCPSRTTCGPWPSSPCSWSAWRRSSSATGGRRDPPAAAPLAGRGGDVPGGGDRGRAFVIVGLLLGRRGRAGLGPALIAFPTVPIAVGVAVLRYRLLEIDRIVSRTRRLRARDRYPGGRLRGSILLLQGALVAVTQAQTIAVAASTLAVFALFQPLRRRVQRTVDRRFDRARFDADRTTAAFAERLRDEVDIGAVSARPAGDGPGGDRAGAPRDVAAWSSRSGHRPEGPTDDRSRLAWGLAVIDLRCSSPPAFIDPHPDYGAIALYVVGIASFVVVGAVLVGRVPGNPIGVMLLAAGTAAGRLRGHRHVRRPRRAPVAPMARDRAGTRAADASFVYPIVIALIGVPLVFPDGRSAVAAGSAGSSRSRSSPGRLDARCDPPTLTGAAGRASK